MEREEVEFKNGEGVLLAGRGKRKKNAEEEEGRGRRRKAGRAAG